MLDEGLAVLEGLWSGELFSFKGKHYTIERAQFLPKPLQQPRIPVWLAGRWPAPRPFRRAARWEGVVPVSRNGMLSPEECREVAAFVAAERGDAAGPFDIVVAAWPGNRTAAQERELVAAYEAAGATWYQVSLSAGTDALAARDAIAQGPPQT
jgi:alkanesulfonate monooxygenase SsuD/methylene tetrahydromethanopterin reductase-like flavin-dependent oxidoreductase (luciferase family)